MDATEIKKIRTGLGISQEDFARLIGVSVGTVNRWEREFFKPSKLAIEKIKSLQRICGKN